MLVYARENVDAGLLTFVEEGLYGNSECTTIRVKGDGPARIGQCNLRGHSEPRRRWIWQTLVHRTTTARRVTGGLLVSHASRFSNGSRLAA
jgi:hypothetical protein